jgi:structural maintenance of chromosomes protein 6
VITDPEEEEEEEEDVQRAGELTDSDDDANENDDRDEMVIDDQPDQRDIRDLSDEAAVERLQNMTSRRSLTVQNYAAENAIIQEITCKNFMCHQYLQVEIGPLINFIIGHNGSGKSAILTALTVCLGGKATATSRASSLKGFIKTGTDKAWLRVKLKNEGRSAFKPDVYGTSIFIERHISISATNNQATSRFVVKSAQGSVISTTRNDVDEILDYFALNLDNPMNVLTQDQARQFLNSASAKDKYMFFNRGTQLETLDKDYNLVEESLNTADGQMDEIRLQVASLKSQYEQAKKNSERIADQRKLIEEMNKLRLQMCWVQVEDRERSIEESEKVVRDLDEKIQEKKEEIEAADVALAEATNLLESAKEKHKKLKEEELDPLIAKKNDISNEFKERGAKLHDLVAEKRLIQSHLTNSAKDIKGLQTKIREEKEKLDNTDSRTAEIHQQLQNAKEKQKEIEEEMTELERQESSAVNPLKECKDEAKNAKDEFSKQQEKVQSCKSRIRAIQSQNGNVSMPSNVKRLVAAIKNSTKFRETPVGPVSDYVYLREPKWSPILETSFGSTLDSFVVTSSHDADELSKLMQQCGVIKPILIGKNTTINTAGQEPAEHLLTWLRVLRISNNIVRNQLIINQGIEKTVLIEDRVEAGNTLAHYQLSRNIRQIFCFADSQEGENRGKGLRVAKTKAGSSITPIMPYQKPLRMRSDMQAQLSFENDVLRSEEENLARLQRVHALAKEKAEKAEATLNRIKRDKKSKKILVDRLEEDVSSLQDRLEEATPQTGVLEALEKKLNEAETSKESYSEAYQNSVTVMDELNVEQREFKAEMDTLDKDIETIKKKVTRAETEAGKLDVRRHDRLTQKNAKIADLRTQENLKETTEGEISKQKEVLTEFINNAREICERIPVPPNETLDSLERKFDRVKQDVGEARRRYEHTISLEEND